jgi:hypothetical protein
MRHRTALAVSLATATATAALALPSGAGAKGIPALAVCGTDGCHSVDRAAVRAGLEVDTQLVGAPRRAEPFFTIRAQVREPNGAVERWSMDWLPRAGVLRAPADFEGHAWSRPAPVLDRALRRAARGLTPKAPAALGSLREPRPEARVVEVFAPADDAGGDDGDGRGPGAAVGAIALVALLAGAGGAAVARARRRGQRADARAALGPDAAR